MTSAMMRSTPTIVQIRPEPRMAVYLSWGEGLTFETLPGCCDGNEFEPLVGFSIPRKQMATVPAAAGREPQTPIPIGPASQRLPLPSPCLIKVPRCQRRVTRPRELKRNIARTCTGPSNTTTHHGLDNP